MPGIDVSPLDLAKTICIFNDYNDGQVPAGEFAPENLLKLAREVVRLSAPQEPVAWRWRNKGGEWWYLDTRPVPEQGYVGKNAEIEPLYGTPYASGTVNVRRGFLSDFLKAINWHNGHGTPSFDRVQAISLSGEAEQILKETAP